MYVYVVPYIYHFFQCVRIFDKQLRIWCGSTLHYTIHSTFASRIYAVTLCSRIYADDVCVCMCVSCGFWWLYYICIMYIQVGVSLRARILRIACKLAVKRNRRFQSELAALMAKLAQPSANAHTHTHRILQLPHITYRQVIIISLAFVSACSLRVRVVYMFIVRYI